ncbi:MAG TPA: hypothetical protein VF426_05685 [Marmoricola sp.]
MSDQPPERPHRIEWVKVAAGALAAVSSALLLSTLGAAGTILGAALGSVVVSLTSSFYSSGLDASRRRMSEAQSAAMRRVGIAQAEVRRANRRAGASGAHLEHADEELAAAKAELDDADPDGPSFKERLALMPWKQVGLFAGGFFLCAVIVITGFELIAGKPVSSLTGGTKGGGTSFSRFDNGQHHPSRSPSVTTSPSATPQPSKSPSARATPSSGASPTATPSEPVQSESPSSEPTESAAASPTP